LVQAVVREAVFDGAVSVLDPACGDGRFLRATGLPTQVGIDIDPATAAAGGFECADSLTRDWGDTRFDVVVGNPPFLNQLSAATTRGGRSRFGGGPYADAAAEFLALAVRLARPGGRVGLVLPQSLLSARDAAAIRHISDDAAALRSWTAKLRPGGRLLVSVPAHQRKFSATDLRVGHVRRYERQELHGLIESAGYEAIQIACYGFPLGNLGRIIGNLLEPRISVDERADAVGRSIRSGTQQSGGVVALGRLLRPWMLWPFFLLQRLTFRFDFGDGYIATAQRRI